MKKTRILLAVIVLLIAAVTVAVLTSVTQVAAMEADGYAVSGTATVKQSLVKGENKVQSMEKVESGDIIYSSALGYYVGANRIAIDKNFPIYINEGDTLKFLDDTNWLVSTNLQVMQTYNGLYMNEGYTYDAEMEQADGQEFVLLALNNGLYINAQEAVLTNSGEKFDIPVNSIIRFAEDSLRWYYFHDGFLVYDEAPVSSLADVYLTVGDSTWYYLDFLKDLDLIKEKIDTKNPTKQLEEEEPSTIASEEEHPEGKPLPKEPEKKDTEEGTEIQLPEEKLLEEEEIFYLGELEDSDRQSTHTGMDEVDSKSAENQDIPESGRSAAKEEASDIAEYDRTMTDGGDDIPDTDRKQTSGGGRSGGGGGSGGKSRPYEKPEISLSEFDPWVYAFAAKLNYKDDSVVLSTPVVVSVYQNIVLDEGVTEEEIEVKKDSQGNSVYPQSTNFNGYVHGTLLKQQSFYGGQSFALSAFRPGSKIYVQYSYSYYTDASYRTKATYLSDFTELQMQPLTEEAVAAVKASWAVPTSTRDIYARKLSVRDIRLENTTDYKESTVFNFENYKKNTLSYLNKIYVTLTKTGAEPVAVQLSDAAVFAAKTQKADFLSASVLEPNSMYTYTVYALDAFGNKFPLVISDEAGKTPVSYKTFSGKAYTRKAAPKVTLRTKEIGKTYFNSELTVVDEEDVIVSTKLQLLDKQGDPVVLSGTIGGDPIRTGATELDIPVSSTEVTTKVDLSLTGLTSYTEYYVQISVTYDPASDYENTQVTYLVTEDVLKQRVVTARDSSDYSPSTVTLDSLVFSDGTKAEGRIVFSDPKNVIDSSVFVTAYDGLGERVVPLTDSGRGSAYIAEGTESSAWEEYYGLHQLVRTAVYKPAEGNEKQMKLTGLVPSSDVYLQISYNCKYYDNGEEKMVTVYSDLVKFTTSSSTYQMDTVLASWEPVFAAHMQGISIENMQLKAANDPGATINSLDKLLDRIELTLTPVNGGETVNINLDSTVIADAKKAASKGAGISFDKAVVENMTTDTVYSYSIRGYRYGTMEIPMKLTAGGSTVSSGEVAGNFYTMKKQPQIRMKTSNNSYGKVSLTLTTDDPDNAVLQDSTKQQTLIFRLKNSQGNPVMLKGKLDGVAFADTEQLDLVNTDRHVLELTGLTVNETYTASVIGGYDQQPTAKASEPSQLIKLNQELLAEANRKFKAEQGKNPQVSVTVTDTWAYAACIQVIVTDPSQVISSNGVQIRVTDSEGTELVRKKSNGTQQIALYPFEPGSKVFLQYSYDYTDAYDGITNVHVDSEVISIQLPTIAQADLPAIYGDWEEVFAYADTRAAFDEFYLKNSTDYDDELSGFSFDNFKKNPLKFLNDITVEFTPVGAGERKTFKITADIIARAKKDKSEWTERLVATAKNSLMSNSKYTYTVEAHDKYGNVIPFKVSTNGGTYIAQEVFTGTVFTRKWLGTVTASSGGSGGTTGAATPVQVLLEIREAVNEIGDMQLKIIVNDKDKALIEDSPLKLSISDKDGKIRMHGDILNPDTEHYGEVLSSYWQNEVELTGGIINDDGYTEYLVKVDNLELGFHYTAQVCADVDLQPDAQTRQEGKDLEILYDYPIGRLPFTAKGTELVKPGGGQGGEEDDPEAIAGGVYVAYWPPEVKLSNFRDWAYAVGVTAKIDDPTATIEKGVSLLVWDDITGNEEYKIVDGHKVYTYFDEDENRIANTGQKILKRKSVFESGDTELSPLQPDNTVYVQANYTFTTVITTIETDPVTRKKTVINDTSHKETVLSDLTEVTLRDLGSYDIAPIGGFWSEDYAAYTDKFRFSSLYFKNTSDYDPQADYNWDNFQRNTVRYLNNLQLTVKEEGKPVSSAITVNLGASVTARAISTEGGIEYIASMFESPLKSDTVYEYTVKAIDSFGNAMPLEIGLDGSSQRVTYQNFSGRIYTRKELPTVEIEQLTNESTGNVSFKVTVKNPQLSLDSEDLKLRVSDALTGTQYAVLDYKLKVGETGTETSYTGKDAVDLPFDRNDTGAVYYLTIESLDFNTGYCAEVTGTYLPQPSAAVPAGKTALDPEEDTELVTYNFSTAPLSVGKVVFNMTVSEEELRSDSAVFNLVMHQNSTQSIVDMVNQILITVSGPEGKVMNVTLTKSDLEQIPLSPGMPISEELDMFEDCRILIRASSVREGDTNLWQAIVGRTQDGSFLTPATIQITLPKDLLIRQLSSKTKYTVSVQAGIKRPNGTAEPLTELYRDKAFTTLKKTPTFLSDDPFIAGNILSILNSRVLDTDGAIASGKATVTLTDTTLGEATVYSGFIPAVASDGTKSTEILYAKLVGGHAYRMEIRADINTSVTTRREVNTLLFSKEFTVEDNLSGELNLESISLSDGTLQKQKEWIYYTPNTTDEQGQVVYGTVHDRYVAGHALPSSNVGYWPNEYQTEKFELKDVRDVVDPQTGEITGSETHIPKAITVDMPMPAYSIYLRIRYYNAAGNDIGYSQYTWKGGTTFIVPNVSDVKYFRLEFSSGNGASFENTGLNIGYYEEAAQFLASSSVLEEYRDKQAGWKIDSRTGLPTQEKAVGYSMVYLVSVNPGDSLVLRDSWDDSGTGGTESHVYYYKEEIKSVKGIETTVYTLVDSVTTTTMANYRLTVPDGVTHVAYDFKTTLSLTASLYRVAGGTASQTGRKYAATFTVEVNDKNGYLKSINETIRKIGDDPVAKLRVWKSESIRKNEWKTDPDHPDKEITLQKDNTLKGWYYAELEEEFLNSLDPEKGWKVGIVVERYTGRDSDGNPKFAELVLDELTFQTDGDYELIHNRQEMRKINRNKYGNFLVVEDFVNNESITVNLFGTLDFQGHVVTYSADYCLLYNLEQSGILRNLVMDIPAAETTELKRYRPIVTYNYGTMDNIMLRTLGEVYKRPENYDMGFLTYYNYGTISNFIFEMGGNLHLSRAKNTDYYYPNCLMYCNYGVFENWYMYGLNGARLIVGNQEDGNDYGYIHMYLIRLQYGIVRRFFTSFETDISYPNPTGEVYFALFYNDVYSDNISNGYVAGDFNLWHEEDGITTRTIPEDDRILVSNTYGSVSNLWHITSNKYEKLSSRITYASGENLRNVKWQQDVLGVQFSTETMALGYYPQLKLNDSMMQYQRYLPLPASGLSDAPEFVSSDKYEDEYRVTTADSGYVQLLFNNSWKYPITEVVIDGLTVDEILDGQHLLSNGLWQVILKVHVDPEEGGQYLSAYNINTFKYSAGTVDIPVGRNTTGVEFWKIITTETQWQEIALNMKWNYRLGADLYLESLGDDAQICLSRTTAGIMESIFTGKIDGAGHTLHDLTIGEPEYGEGSTYWPCVIWMLGNGGEIRDLIVDNMQITSKRYPKKYSGRSSEPNKYSGADSYFTGVAAGFIGYAVEGSVINGLHVQNSRITSTGNVGALVGFMKNYCSMYNSSSVNNQINDGYNNALGYAEAALVTDTESYYGGLVGGMYSSVCMNCFTRDVSIKTQYGTYVEGIGGMVGRMQGSTVTDGYATGTITAAAYNVGGAIGNFRNSNFCHFDSIWTRVTLDVAGDYVGGFAGRVVGTGTGILAVGDIFCDTGTHVHRAVGQSFYDRMKTTLTSYASQSVTGLSVTDKDDCRYLITTADLGNWSVWADKVLLSDNWDVITAKSTSSDVFPKVYKTPETYDSEGNRVLVDRQTNIYLPGKGGEHSLSVELADYMTANGGDLFTTELTITTPGLRGEDFVAQWNSAPDKTEVLNIDGFYMTPSANTKYNWTAETVNNPDGSITGIASVTVEIGGVKNWTPYSKALDCYRLTVNYHDLDEGGNPKNQYMLMADLTYTDVSTKKPKYNYWDIATVTAWYTEMERHGKNGENFRLTAMLDFKDSVTGKPSYKGTDEQGTEVDTWRNLRINRLVGRYSDIEGSSACGIKNLKYTTNKEGDPWIANVEKAMENLVFENITGDMIHTNAQGKIDIETENPRTGVIFSVRDITNCRFDTIRANFCTKTKSNSAFIMIGHGTMTDVTLKNLIYDTSNITDTYSYGSGFMCHVQGSVIGLKASNIYVNAPKGTYIGGVFATINSSVQSSQEQINMLTIRANNVWGGIVSVDTDGDGVAEQVESKVKGYNYVGYFAGQAYANLTYNTIGKASTETENNRFNVESNDYAAGFVAYHHARVFDTTSSPGSKGNKVTNGVVKSLNTGVGYAGGMYGYTGYQSNNYEDIADGMTVLGNGYVGGLYAYNEYNFIYKAMVTNCTIGSLVPESDDTSVNCGYGGVAGQLFSYSHIYGATVRNTNVGGTRNVGGVVGCSSVYNNYYIDYCYVADDVTVSATSTGASNAGGIVGYGSVIKMYYNACGASINASGSNAGGLVGQLYHSYDTAPEIQSCYFVGNVTGKDYVGGIIGLNRNEVTYTASGKTLYAVTGFRYNGTKTNYPNDVNRQKSVTGYLDQGYMNGVTVAGSFRTTVTENPHISLWYNNYLDPTQIRMEGDDPAWMKADDPRLLIWDQCVLNGAPVNKSEVTLFEHSRWASSEVLRDKSVYISASGANLGTTYFDYDFKDESETESQVLKVYMPYVKYRYDTTKEYEILKYSNYKSHTMETVLDEETERNITVPGAGVCRAGIKLPDYGTNPDAIQVYASGADTVNIEVTRTSVVTDDWSNYQQVEYIQTTGTQWIDTGYSPQVDYVKYEFQWMESGTLETSGSALFGSYNSSNGCYSGFPYHDRAANAYLYAGNSSLARISTLPVDTVLNGTLEGKYVNNKNRMYFTVTKAEDGSSVGATSGPYGSTVRNGANIALFGRYDNSTSIVWLSKNVRMYSWKVYEDRDQSGTYEESELAINMVPCYHITSGITGMYDTVKGEFHANRAAADFLLGPDVNAGSPNAVIPGKPGKDVLLYVRMGDGPVISGPTVKTDADGILTLNYNFNCDIAVSEDNSHWVTYTADELRRAVTVTEEDGDHNDFWYYIGTDAGGDRVVNYGTESGTEVPVYTIPPTYQRIKYIQGMGNSHAVTNIYGDARIEYRMVYTDTTKDRRLTGIHTSWGAAHWGFNTKGNYENGGNDTGVKPSSDENNPDTIVYDFHSNGYTTLTVNGVKLHSYGKNSFNATTYPVGILGFNNTNSYEMEAKLYEMKIWQKGELVAWLVPVIKDYQALQVKDRITGMYNVLNGDFFGPVRNSFTPGPEDTSPIPTKRAAVTGTLTLTGDGGQSYEPLHIWTSATSGTPTTCILAYSEATGKTQLFTVAQDAEGGTASAMPGAVITNGTVVSSRPFLTEVLNAGGSSVTYKVYKNATMAGTTRERTRIYLDGDMRYDVSPWQDIVYDKVLLDDRGAEGEYLAVLSKTGTLTANFECGDLDTRNIKEINNVFYADDPYLVVLYRSGSLCVYDYTDGALIYETESNAGFASYLKSVFSSMSSSLSGLAVSGTNTESGTNTDGGNIPLTLTSYTTLSLPGLTVTSGAVGSGLGDGIRLAAGTAAGGKKTEDDGHVSGSGREDADAATVAAEGGLNSLGGAADAKEGGVLPETAEGKASGSGTSDKEGTVKAEEGVLAEPGTKAEDGTESAGAAVNGTEPGPEAYEGMTVASAVYVPGEGIIASDGTKVADESEVEYVEGEGIYADDELIYEESLYADNEKLTAAVEETFREKAETAASGEGFGGNAADSEDSLTEGSDVSGEEGLATDGISRANGTSVTGKVGAGLGNNAGTAALAGDGNSGIKAGGTAGGGTGGPTGESAYREESGETAEDGSSNGNGGAAGGSAESAEKKSKKTVLLVTKADKERQLREAAGKNVRIMNTVTGEMDEYDSEALSDGELITAAEKKAAETAALAAAGKTEQPDEVLAEVPEQEILENAAAAGAFVVAGSLGRTLDGASGNGLRLILLMAAAILVIMGVIYYINLQKKRSKLRLRGKKESGEEENQ